MNEKHKIDDLFKEALRDYREELPSDKTEAQIYRKLNNTKYLRLLKLNLLIFAIAIPMSLLAYLVFNTITKNHSSVTNNTSITSVKFINNPLKNNQNPALSQKNLSTINNTLAFHKSESKKISSTNIQQSKFKIQETELKEKSEKVLSIKSEEVHSSGLTFIEEEKSSASQLTNTTQLKEKKDTVIETDVQASKPFLTSAAKTADNPPDKVEKANLAVTKKNDSSSVQNTDEIFKKRPKTKPSFALELSGNLYIVDKKLNSSNEFVNLVKVRNENESEITTLTPSIEVRYNSKYFFVQTGISYLILGEKINYNLTNVKTTINTSLLHRDTLVYVYSIINPPEGQWQYDTIWYNSLDTTYTISKHTINQTNTYKYFEIPLLLGKSFTFNKFSIDVSSGISFGILLKANAQILTADNQSFLSIDDKNSPYMNTLTLNYLLRLAFSYSINERWSVFARPELKYNLGNILNEKKYPVQQKYALYGFGMGLIYNF